MKKLCILFLIYSLNLFAQNDFVKTDSIEKIAFKIDSIKGKSTENFKLKLDSITIVVNKYSKVINVKNYFNKSKTEIEINYYSNNSGLFLVTSKERNLNNSEEYLTTTFHLENDKVISKNYSAPISACIPINVEKDIYEELGYSIAINKNFLEFYIFELIAKIKNHR
jgi:hypothetical protein